MREQLVMYGMVNNAFRAYVIDHQGEAAWNDIVERAGLDVGEFGGMTPYDDSVTLAIVGAMVQRSGQSVDDVLRDVGRHWIGFARTTPFANLLAMAGTDFASSIANLDEMHARIQTSLPTIRPPSFACSTRDDGHLEITYHSERDGLFPFVIGVLEGLAAGFGQQLEVIAFEALSPSSAKWTLKVAAMAEHAA